MERLSESVEARSGWRLSRFANLSADFTRPAKTSGRLVRGGRLVANGFCLAALGPGDLVVEKDEERNGHHRRHGRHRQPDGLPIHDTRGRLARVAEPGRHEVADDRAASAIITAFRDQLEVYQ